MKPFKNIFKVLAIVVTTPIVLFLLLAVVVYLPPVQQWAKNQLTTYLSKETGADISLERIRLAFPLDLALDKLLATQQGDTLLAADAVRLNIPLKPLLHGIVDIRGFELWRAQLNTKDFLNDVEVTGSVGMLRLQSPAIVNIRKEIVDIHKVELSRSNVYIALSDTAQTDSTASEPTKWKIHLDDADIQETTFFLRMPGDSMRLAGEVAAVRVKNAAFDLGCSDYRAEQIDIRQTNFAYDIPQAPQSTGFDTNHISLKDLNTHIDTLRYYDGHLTVGIPLLSFKEQSGLELYRLTTQVALDTTEIHVSQIILETPHTKIEGLAHLTWNALKLQRNGKMQVDLQGSVGRPDILLLAGDAAKDIIPYYPDADLHFTTKAKGDMRRLQVETLEAKLPGYALLRATGHVDNLPNEELRDGLLQYQLQTFGLHHYQRLLPASTQGSVALPEHMALNGTLNVRGDRVGTNSKLSVGSGSMMLNGFYGLRSETYKATINAVAFPLNTFLPKDSLSPLTASIEVEGRGLDFYSSHTQATAKAQLEHFTYSGLPLDSIRLEAQFQKGKATANIVSENRLLKAQTSLNADISKQSIAADLKGIVDDFDFFYATNKKDSTHVKGKLNLNGALSTDGKTIHIGGDLKALQLIGTTSTYAADDIFFGFSTSQDSTQAFVYSGDLNAHLYSNKTLDNIAESIGQLSELVQTQLKAAHFDEKALTPYLPNMDLYVSAGKNNPAIQLMRMHGYDADSIYLKLRANETGGIDGNMQLLALRTGALLLDRTTARLIQDSTGVRFLSNVTNTSKRNPNKFTASLNGYMLTDGFSISTLFKDDKQVKGLELGVEARLSPNGDITFRLFPEHSVIAYRKFTVNKDNYFTWGQNKYVKANIDLLADDRTGLRITTPEGDSTRDVSISLASIHLDELSAVLPYMPQLGGLLNADLHAQWEGDSLSAVGQMDITKFRYEEAVLGDLEAELAYFPDGEDKHYVEANISTGGEEVLTLMGDYINKGDGALDMMAQLLNFPAQMLNGFMGADGTAALSGHLNGDLAVTGPASAFLINGKLSPDSLHVLSPLYGVDLSVENRAIEISDSKVVLEKLAMHSATAENPLIVSGNVDFSNLEAIRMNINFRANNFEVVSSERTKQSVLFGKVFTDIDATLRGTTDLMFIRGTLKVLGNTDMTYIMKDSPLTVEDRLNGLVEFVDFSDTIDVKQEETVIPAGGVFIGMTVSISDQAKLHVELSEDGDSYFDGQGGGNLNLRYFPNGEINLTGRFTLTRGELKYALPFIPLKTFNLDGDNNYVNFTGDPFNPSLNITAMETTRASVSDDNQSTRMVMFNVGVAITQTLNNMGLQFLIEAPNDLNVQNDLAAMSIEEKGKLAVTMLATGMYLTSSNKSSFKANNALNAFLQSEIQNIAGDALKTIDLTVGVEGSTSASGNAQTDYSFQFAKHLWNDRVTFKIGGKVTAGSEQASENQSFIDNVTLEYRLGNGTSRNLRLFYDHDTTDPLEGTYSSAGAGLVLRKKTNTFGEIFLFRRKKENEQ